MFRVGDDHSDVALTLEEAEINSAYNLSCTLPSQYHKPISLNDVYQALQVGTGYTIYVDRHCQVIKEKGEELNQTE